MLTAEERNIFSLQVSQSHPTTEENCFETAICAEPEGLGRAAGIVSAAG